MAQPSAPPATVAEIESSRTEYSREYQLSDGTRRLEVSVLPMNYKDDKGAWQPIDSEITPSAKDGFEHENVHNEFKSYFADEGDRQGTIAVWDGGFGLEVSPANSKTDAGASAEVTKDEVEYQGLFPDTTEAYTVLPGMLKEQLILGAADAPTLFQFRINATELKPVLQDDGSIIFFDSLGTPHFVLPQPYAEDSADDPAACNPQQVICREGDHYVYEMTVDAKWLNDPARVFPVVVDPTVTTDDMAVDTYVASAYPTTNYSSSWTLDVSGTGTGAEEDTLLRFNLPTIDGNPAIISANVSLYKQEPHGEVGTSTIHAYQITSDWTTAVTWNTKPTHSTTADSDTSADGSSGYYAFDITPSAMNWYEQGATNYGVQLRSTGTGSNTRTFSSRNDRGCWPTLAIVYSFADPRHSTYDLGDFAGHSSRVTLIPAHSTSTPPTSPSPPGARRPCFHATTVPAATTRLPAGSLVLIGV